MLLTVLSYLLGLMSPQESMVKTLAATLYAQGGGVSAGGVGEVRLATSDYILDLSYQRPLDTHFSSEKCWELGAEWSVQVVINTPGEGILRTSTCNGHVDHAIHSSWLGAQRFLDSLAKHDVDSALSMRTAQARNGQFSSDRVNTSRLDLTGYQKFGGGRCLSVGVKRNQKEVVIKAGLSCFIKDGTRNISLALVMVPESDHQEWLVERVVASSLFEDR